MIHPETAAQALDLERGRTSRRLKQNRATGLAFGARAGLAQDATDGAGLGLLLLNLRVQCGA